jgi:alkylation response protein AidB-like acyl-CoA dehydrogenase
MGRLATTEGLTEVQQEILSTVRGFVDKEIIPYATDLEHKDEFPEAIVEGMKEMGLFGLMIPEEYGGSASRCSPTRSSSRRSPAAG